MDTSQARDHLDSAATILRHADRRLRFPAWVFIIWGLFGTTVNTLAQMRVAGFQLPSDSTIQLPLLLVAIGATVVMSLRGDSQRETLVDRHTGILFAVVFGVLLLASVILQHKVVPYQAIGIFWGLGFAIALIVVGIEASRPLLIGGFLLLVACLSTAWFPGFFNGLLALGWFAGMVLPGVILAWKRVDG
ncbi:MAG: hypothetical protein QNJ19_14215 [Woeseiaceae bacterium]|nr:hypothetical protein [Woeseiaceae bacterium]